LEQEEEEEEEERGVLKCSINGVGVSRKRRERDLEASISYIVTFVSAPCPSNTPVDPSDSIPHL
jgi:hypothetical protein